MQDELVERLEATSARIARYPDMRSTKAMLDEAAAEIRRLSGLVERAREALIHADLKIRSYPGADQSDVEFIRATLAEMGE